MEASHSNIHHGFSWQTGPGFFQGPSEKILDLWKRKLQFFRRSKNFLVMLWPAMDRLQPLAVPVFNNFRLIYLSVVVGQNRIISLNRWFFNHVIRRPCWPIRSKTKPVYENAVTGMWGSCTSQVMGSWWNLFELGTDAQSLTWSSQLWALLKQEWSEDLNAIWTQSPAIPMRYTSGWAIRPTRSWSSCEFLITPRRCTHISVESMTIMFERWSEVQLVKHCTGVVRSGFKCPSGLNFSGLHYAAL